MPKKRGGKKKGKKSKSSGDDASDGGKKKKLTKQEKDLAKIEKQCDTFRRSGAAFQSFINQMDAWLAGHHEKAIELFRKLDEEGECYVSFDEFKAGVSDLSIPCNAVELHTLCTMLADDEMEEPVINYMDLRSGLRHVREEREAEMTEEDMRPGMSETKRDHIRCTHCNMVQWDGEPYKVNIHRYIEILFKMVTFDNFREYHGHFNCVVHSHSTVLGLVQIIRDVTGIESSSLSIFTDKSRDLDVMLPLQLSLEECGFKGGSQDEPEELLLYYDYRVEFADCPLLMCDHYLGYNVIKSK